jgi:RND family efflux transporter MFP subunit
MITKILNLWRRFSPRYRWLGIGLIVVAGGAIAFGGRGNGEVEQLVPVTRQTVRQEVKLLGTVTPLADVDLAFDRAGRVSRVAAPVGTVVAPGDLVVALENRALQADVQEAAANLAAEESRLLERQRGTRPEQLAVDEAALAAALEDQASAESGLAATLRDAFSRSDNAVRQYASQLFTSSATQPQLVLPISNFNFKIEINRQRRQLEKVLTEWSAQPAEVGYEFAREQMLLVQDFLADLILALSSVTLDTTLSTGTTVAQARADVTTARNGVADGLAALESAWEKFQAAGSARTTAEQNLALARSGATAEEIAIQEAAVGSARARLLRAQAELAETLLRSPVAGVVTLQEAETGELVTAGTVVARVISQDNFQIEVRISEADVAKVKAGDSGEATLDAYGEARVFPVTVTRVDPGETVSEGISTYLAVLAFATPDPAIKSGLTANVTLVTAEREGVLTVPLGALQYEQNQAYVEVVENDEAPVKRSVEVGLEGGGVIEVLSGLREGEMVVAISANE